ncbi:hypothetical protein ABPG72_020511 [Tetrahymena utriculariae]
MTFLVWQCQEALVTQLLLSVVQFVNQKQSFSTQKTMTDLLFQHLTVFGNFQIIGRYLNKLNQIILFIKLLQQQNQVMVHVMPYYIRQQPDMACQKLVKESNQFWKQHDDVVDDITVICVFLHKNKPKLNSQTKESDQEESQNPIKTIGQDDKEEEESILEVNEKVSEEIDKTHSKTDDGHIQGTEDKSAGGRFSKNNTQQQKLQSPVNSQAQVTINMKKRKEQKEKEVNDILQKEFNNLNELIGSKTQEKKQDLQTQQQKASMTKNKPQISNSKQDNRKKTEENSKSLIPDVDESADSEYSKDFELDRQREEKESKGLKEKQKKKDKSPFKSQEIQQYNFDNDDEDDEAFFKNL